VEVLWAEPWYLDAIDCGEPMLNKSSFAIPAVLVALSACAPTTDDGESAAAAEAQVTTREASKTALYAGICGFQLAAYDPAFAIRFYVQASTGANQLTLSMTPLVGWDLVTQQPAPPSAITQSQTCGRAVTATSSLSDGAYSAHFGRLDIPAVGNSINGVDVRIANVQLDGPFQDGSPRFCAGLSGAIVDPVQYELKREENTCIFVKVNDGDPLPALTSSDFHCP
jgi:hypothetical protein